MNPELLYSAAHAEFPDTEPLGGGKAVADFLVREWRRSAPFPLTVLSPHSLDVVTEAPLTELGERQYGRFCRRFEQATTAEILRRDPRRCRVLSNDISEGPDFARLGARGYRVTTIVHVDVVEYFTKFYLRGMLPPELLARFRWFRLLPPLLRLVFEKQAACVRHSARLIVPSPPMRDTLLRCYPWCPPARIVVFPWGDVSPRPGNGALPAGTAAIDPFIAVAEDEFVIVTLSRLSPEKGIERLLAALRLVEPGTARVRVFVCGAPAYMKGHRYEQRLRRLAAKITTARVEFTGQVTGAHKAGLLRRADLFVSPSRHESYGLAIAEATAAGCRIISHPHYGASGLVVNCDDRPALATAITALVAGGRTRKPSGGPEPQTSSAQQLAQLLTSDLPD